MRGAVGANGSGKSTAVRAIAGLLEPSARDGARLRPRSRTGSRTAEAARAALALVPDTPLLYDDLTVRQHLELVTLSHGCRRGRIDRAAAAGSASPRATDFLPRELSRGMRQKTMLACALVRPAAVLVLDEPVVGLDPPSQALLRELLASACAPARRCCSPPTRWRSAEGLADRAVLLEEGEVADQGPWAEVRERAQARGWTSP